jgi:ammonium transporter Rh
MENNKSVTGANQSGNMYSYQEEQKVPVVETGAIRRSLGEGNPNAISDYQLNNINNSSINQERVNNQNSMVIQVNQNPPLNWMFFLIFGIIQIIIIILIANYYNWDVSNNPINSKETEFNLISGWEIDIKYKLFQDINIMIFLGFGFLRSFLKHHSWTSIALTFIGGVLSFEFGLFILICWGGIFKPGWSPGLFNFGHFLDSNYCSAAIVISLGAVLGKISLSQYIFMILFETIFSTFNYVLLRQKLRIIDVGGALTIHLFGSIFGAIFSLISFGSKNERERIKKSIHFGSNYNSNIFALFGTLILITYWPSFNTSLVNDDEYKFQGVINTYLAILGSIVGTFCISPICNLGKIKIKDILNSSFSGAIIVAGCCHIIKHLWVSILSGVIGGGLTTYLCNIISDRLKRKGFHDTSDIIYYHGIPGFLGGIITTIYVGNQNQTQNKEDLYQLIGTIMNYSETIDENNNSINIPDYAGKHFGSIFLTIVIALSSGFVAGFAIKFCNCNIALRYFNDSEFFDVSENEPFPWEDEQVQLQVRYISGSRNQNN